MVKKEDRQGKIVLLLVMTFVILAVVITVFVTVQRGALVKKINQNKAVLAEKSKEALAEEHAAELGWNKMIEGNLTKVDLASNMIEVDVDPLGEKKRHKVQIDKGAKVFKETQQQSNEDDCGEGNENEDDCLASVKIFKETAFLKDLKEGQLVDVYFPKRTDLETESLPIAVEIVILPN